MWCYVFMLAYLATVSAVQVHFKDCGSTMGKISSVDINPCPEEPCHLIRGKNTSVTVGFSSNEASGSLKAVVHGIIAGLPIAFPLPNADGCKSSGVSCPVTRGSSYSYTASLPVLKIYPTIKVVVKWELHDESDNNVFCFVVPVEITD
ncbi:NPC intracellular cholesterol transporter 2-like [Liolophura sinensis]|uniref:NPC intracellular cholesterol transporter 2-like n=1 Tax=Liolophura sinensis TaxID=3198878 RepID=UPI003157F29D